VAFHPVLVIRPPWTGFSALPSTPGHNIQHKKISEPDQWCLKRQSDVSNHVEPVNDLHSLSTVNLWEGGGDLIELKIMAGQTLVSLNTLSKEVGKQSSELLLW
jgi:hypothetical protein